MDSACVLEAQELKLLLSYLPNLQSSDLGESKYFTSYKKCLYALDSTQYDIFENISLHKLPGFFNYGV
jgi:hypothetical protein